MAGLDSYAGNPVVGLFAEGSPSCTRGKRPAVLWTLLQGFVIVSFLAGCLTTAIVWAVCSWWRNPHGHRGGQEIPDNTNHTPIVVPSAAVYSLPVRYHRTG